MNELWQVGRTYWWRPRFWIFGGIYLWATLWQAPLWLDDSYVDARLLGVLGTVTIGCVVASLVALHLRRQFATAGAHLVPHFAPPHLAVAAIWLASVWVLVPALAAWRAEQPMLILPLIVAFSTTAIFMALVAIWPKAVLLLASSIVGMLWLSQRPVAYALFDLATLENAWIAVPLIGTALLLLAAAVVVLLRLSDRNIAASDDFTVDVSGERSATGWLGEFQSRWRDAAIARTLRRPHGWLWTLSRWRVPGTISGVELYSVFAIVALLIAIGWLATRSSDGAMTMAVTAGVAVLFVPFSSWHFRLRSLASESMRPVTRGEFASQLLAAMLVDFVLWGLISSLIIGTGLLALAWQRGGGDSEWRSSVEVLTIFVSVLTLFYGIASVTMHYRYWLPLLLVSFVCSLLGIVMTIGYLAPYLGPYFIWPTLVAVGLLLNSWTWYRLRTMDLT